MNTPEEPWHGPFPEDLNHVIELLAKPYRLDVLRALASPPQSGRATTEQIAALLTIALDITQRECQILRDAAVLDQEADGAWIAGERLSLSADDEERVRIRVHARDAESFVHLELQAVRSDR